MTLRELEYLVALAKYRHFGRAAEACLISQPTLSAQIKKLEAELGVQLIERDARGAILTAFGKKTAERAKRILAEVEHIKDAAQESRNPESGALRLGIFPTLGPYLLPFVMPRIAERFKSLQTLLIEEKSDGLIDRLRDGEIDAAILALPVADDQLVSDFLFEEAFLLAVPRNHRLNRQETIATSELLGEELMLLEEGHCLRDQALEVCTLSGAFERPTFRGTSLETLRHMVASGIGVTLLPKLATLAPSTAVDTLGLVRFEASPAPSRRIALVWRKSSARENLFRDLAAVIRDVIAPMLEDVAIAAE
ncbi:LysR substrate-binding domain-containing protein [Neorhizobium alkalisoli]|uniref:HTH-type transcriptional regulator TtuA n=1 Tax=Neorhizobium alkalisoli TaxID=528178 RepID=A0A561QIL5_9HYPH|nr:LysR substrate-binding domain-containing protein [Neorhizobium alkalisoli]TWF50186.1 LysR family transcriptional regulator [Neorhizobium alkalisoli]